MTATSNQVAIFIYIQQLARVVFVARVTGSKLGYVFFLTHWLISIF
jgi:hypothetical protein